MQFADLKRWRSFCIREPCHLHLQVLVCICLHLLEIVLKPSWSLLEISRSLLEIFLKLTLHVPAQVLTKNYDSPGVKFWLNLAMTHSPAAACHGRCRCLQAIHLFELATTCYNSVPILGVMAQCALSRHNRRWVMLDPMQAVRPGEGQRWSLWDVRSSQVKSGQQDKTSAWNRKGSHFCTIARKTVSIQFVNRFSSHACQQTDACIFADKNWITVILVMESNHLRRS